MRYIGNKTNLLKNINQVIKDNCDGNEKVFCDLFSGTSSVARFFKNRYKIISNDILYFSYVLQRATITNNEIPDFEKLKNKLNVENVLDYLETININRKKYKTFIYDNYSPNDNCERMYLTPENAKRIDYIRTTIEKWKKENLIKENEYFYLLATLIEGVPFVSNITGTYGAYLKDWDKRAFKKFEMIRLNVVNNNEENECYREDANELIKKVSGDILYIDPPYNSRQYLPNYHLLETIARYDEPKINGKTGIRTYTEEKSNYCIKSKVYDELEELIKNAKFKHIIMSYNQEGLLKKEEIEQILKKYGDKDTYKLYQIPYKQYENKLTKKIEKHYEYIFYIKKKEEFNINNIYINIPMMEKVPITLMEDEEQYIYDIDNYMVDSHKKYIKSPLNYIGGKYKLLPQLMKYFPTDINTFVDLFSGGFNVGINVKSNKTICNDINDFIIDLYKELYNSSVENVLDRINTNIKGYGLSKENESAYKKFRVHYNETKDPIDLYTLTCYSFNYQFRFNNNREYNNPFGRNRSQFSENMKNNLILFSDKLKNMNIEFSSKDFDKVSIENLGKDDFIYCDPPYLITTGSYNDGNRGFKDWKEEEEIKLYNYLDKANEKNIKFALSNVMEHKGKENKLLKEWSKKYKVIYLDNDYSNSSYNTKKGKSKEVLIINY
ncbi:MAG: Dam family site-specific DNA-(adenine-N6)-methyltransferase [Clostridia bacterium]